MKKKKIAEVVQLQILYGSQRVALDICEQLDREKYDICVLCAPSNDDGNAFVREVKRLRLQLHVVPHYQRSIGLPDLFAFFEFLAFFKKNKFDIVHTHGSKAGFLARIAARVAGVPLVIHTVHGVPYHNCLSRYAQWFFKSLERFAGMFAHRIVFVSDNQRRQAIRERIVPADKAVTIYNGVTEIERDPRKYSGDKLLIGAVGRFWTQKNFIVTIKAAIEACKKNPALQFAFLGDGEYYEQCLGMIKENKLEDRIILPGWQDNVSAWLDRFDVFLLYSLWEGLPVAIIEAMNMGLPIIASDIDGNNELVDDRNGFLVDVKKPDELVELLVSLTDKKDRLEDMSKQSIQKIRERFQLSRMLEEYIRNYEN